MKTNKEMSPEKSVETMFAKFNDTQLSGLSLGLMMGSAYTHMTQETLLNPSAALTHIAALIAHGPDPVPSLEALKDVIAAIRESVASNTFEKILREEGL